MIKLLLSLKNNSKLSKRIDGTGLYLFRIVFGMILFFEVSQMKIYQHLMFDEIPYLEPTDVNFNVLLVFWLIAIFCMLIGYKTRMAAMLNFVMTTFFFMTLNEFEYHVFYSYQSISFLFLFLPISRGISIDNLIQKLKYSGPYQSYKPDLSVNIWSYYLPILFALGFVYFDSVFYKLVSQDIWMKGLGMWLPASLPQMVHLNLSWLLNQEYMVKFLGYLTIIFEGLFMFLFWFKKFRVPVFIIGVGLHVGILLAFPIPLFALTAIGVYILLIPVTFWEKIKIKRKETIKFFYDAECPMCVRTKIILSSIIPSQKVGFYSVQGYAEGEQLLKDLPKSTLYQDIHGLKKNKVYKGVDLYRIVFLSTWYLVPIGLVLATPGVNLIGKLLYDFIAKSRVTERCTQDSCGYIPPMIPKDIRQTTLLKDFTFGDLQKMGLVFLIGLMFVSQFLVTWRSPHIQQVINFKTNSFLSSTNLLFEKVQWRLKPVSYRLMGITAHPVFMDGHMNNYNHLITITDLKGEFIPLLDDKGMAGNLIYGANWVNYTFRVNGANIKQEQLITGLKNYLTFWIIKNEGGEHLNQDFIIKMKKVDFPTDWERDFLNKMIARPWTDIGVIGWKQNKFYCNLPDVESL
jgi:predicted DCC family thiol-disulfide oxidoreductase YuxK/uncharacterized membrane protein YphA (DoxX/SURF4 family)